MKLYKVDINYGGAPIAFVIAKNKEAAREQGKKILCNGRFQNEKVRVKLISKIHEIENGFCTDAVIKRYPTGKYEKYDFDYLRRLTGK